MLLLLHLLIDHLLLLVLAQAIELVMLHGLFLLYGHRHLFIWIGKEIVLLDVGHGVGGHLARVGALQRESRVGRVARDEEVVCL